MLNEYEWKFKWILCIIYANEIEEKPDEREFSHL